MGQYRALISGSVAYDFLMLSNGDFPTGIAAAQAQGAAEDFTAAYIATDLRRCLGGCAANIAYAFRGLGNEPQVVGVVGHDGDAYLEHFRGLGISPANVLQLKNFWTAQAYIFTDEKTNQLIFFHPGASNEAHQQGVAGALPVPLAIVSPNGKEGMMQHVRDLTAAGVPTIFDPGQALSLFSAEELLACIDAAAYFITNDGEFEKVLKLTGLSADEVVARAGAVFVTLGERGSRLLRAAAGAIECEGLHLGETKNPTGCGDAFRAGLMHGMLAGWDMQSAMRCGSIIGALCAAHDEPQGYALSLERVLEIYAQQFGGAPDVAESA